MNDEYTFYPLKYTRCKLADGYMINKVGQLYSPFTKRVINGTRGTGGYLTYNVFKEDGSKTNIKAHVAVAEQFIPNPNNLPIINHIDQNKMNPRWDNLEWCSSKENINSGDVQERRKESKYVPINEYTTHGKYIRTWKGACFIGQYLVDYNFTNNDAKSAARAITACCSGDSMRSKGKIWRYYDGTVDDIVVQDNVIDSDWNFSDTNIFNVDYVPEEYLYKFHNENELVDYFLRYENFTNKDIRLFKELLYSLNKKC